MSTFGSDSLVTVVDGEPVAFSVPFGSNSLQHGTGVFDSVRGYHGVTGPVLLRSADHARRLLRSARYLGIRHQYDESRLEMEIARAAAIADLADCYLRPAFVTAEPRLGVDLARLKFRLAIEVWPAAPARETARPVRLAISPWSRPSPRSFPVGAKATGCYALSALARTQAGEDGFDDAVQLDPDSGRVAEATVSNVFVVKDGAVRTPWLQDSLLAGITRDCVLTLARSERIPAAEGPVTVEDLLDADEVFLTGTASGLIPVAGVEERRYGELRPVFEALRAAYARTVTGRAEEDFGWLSPVNRLIPIPDGIAIDG